MTTPPTPTQPPLVPYAFSSDLQPPDRMAWLIIAGIFELLVALGIFGMIGLIILAALITPNEGGPVMLIKLVLIYGSAAVFFVIMGIGTIRAKRWARSLMNAACWLWLVFGVMTALVCAAVLPRTFARSHHVSQEAILIITVLVCCFVALFMILVPGLLLLVYGNAGVKATCERRNQFASWTDRIPTAPLVLLILLTIGVLSDVWMAVTHPMFPIGFKYLTHKPGGIAFLITAVWRTFVLRECFHLRLRGWWLALITYIVSVATTLVTLWHADLTGAYREAGYSSAVVAQTVSILKNPSYTAVLSLAMIASVVFVFTIRKYYRGS